jgi:hypothetical protein
VRYKDRRRGEVLSAGSAVADALFGGRREAVSVAGTGGDPPGRAWAPSCGAPALTIGDATATRDVDAVLST